MKNTDKKILQEDCSEDQIGSGILTLTNERIVFDKTRGRIIDFSKKFGNMVIDISLNNIIDVCNEGIFMKKICIKVKINEDIRTYKFGVFNNKNWLKILQKTLEDYKNQ